MEKTQFSEEVNEEPSLADSAEDSRYFFRLLNIEVDFLQKDVKDCSLDEEYLQGKKASKYDSSC